MSITKFLPAALVGALGNAGDSNSPEAKALRDALGGGGETGGPNNKYAKDKLARRAANKRARASRKRNRQ